MRLDHSLRMKISKTQTVGPLMLPVLILTMILWQLAAGGGECPCTSTADPCCGQDGYCGHDADHCFNCQISHSLTTEIMSCPQAVLRLSFLESGTSSCAADHNSCTPGECCNKLEFCGNTNEHCGDGCLGGACRRKSGLSTGAKIGLGLGIGSFCASALALALVRTIIVHFKRETTLSRNLSVVLSSDSFHYSSRGLRKFSYQELEIASDGFSNLIGEGPFGEVYKGTLENNREISVKRLLLPRTTEASLERQLQSLEQKIETIGFRSLIHPNLVRLIGYCFHEETGERLLVYEYCQCRSLADWLFEPDEHDMDPGLNVDKEFIALYIARGLDYIHSELQFHLNIKPENILLNRCFEPKLSDFGVAQFLDADDFQVDQESRADTNWYRAPEVRHSTGEASSKSDVFSFGIVLLELVCGRRVFRVVQGREEYLPLLVLRAAENAHGGELAFVDPKFVQSDELEDENSTTESNDEKKRRARRLIRVALWCLQQDPTRRPTMSDVISLLNPYLEYHGEEYPVDTRLPDGLKADLESGIGHNVANTNVGKFFRSSPIIHKESLC